MHYRLISSLDKPPMLDLQDRGLHYGDGLFETMLMKNGVIHYWPEHFERLSESAERLFIRCPPKDWFERNFEPYLVLNETLILKIILTRGSGGRGIQLPDDPTSHVYLLHYEVDTSAFHQPVIASFSEVTLADNRKLAGLKHLNRLDYVLASEQLKRRSGFNEALLSNSAGRVIEGIVHNLFFIGGGIVYTPRLDSCGVDGVMRQRLLKILKAMPKEVRIDSFSRQDIVAADECFLCNSVQGIRPIIRLEDTEFCIGPITQMLQQIVNGQKS